MVTPRLLPLSIRRLNGQMPKLYLATLENVVVEAESQHGVVVWSSAQNCPPTIPTDSYPLQLIVLPGEEIQRHLPETLHVEATGLGGRDLSYPIPWDISIRSDKEGQSVYGPSLDPMEEGPGSPKKNWMLCSSTGPPDATAQTHMKRKGIVGLESKKSRHGGRNARIGWRTLKNKVNPLFLTSRSC